MDLHQANLFLLRHWTEIAGLFTLGVSLWIAFGPLRHRLPKVLTRFGKYSAALKLLCLSGICWFFFCQKVFPAAFYGLFAPLGGRVTSDPEIPDEPSLALNWMLGSLGVILLAGALWVVTRRQDGPKPKPPALPSLPRKRSSEPQTGV